MRLVSGPTDPLLPELSEAATRHAGGLLELTVAWVNDEGAALLLDATSPAMARLQAVVGINNQGTTVEGLLRLLGASKVLRVLYQHPFATFHPKAYCFDDGTSGTLIVGSSNLTAGGLDTNFEASMVLDLTPDLRTQWRAFWRSLKGHHFSHAIDSEADVERLYKGGYIGLEATIRAQQRRSVRRRRRIVEGDDPDSVDLPTEGPVRRFRSTPPPVEIPFEVVEEPPEPPAEIEEGVETDVQAPPSPTGGHRVFVRTLTPNDVAKLHGDQSGTFEPDLGLAAREEDPGFWGWPDEFSEVVRQLPRLERKETVELVSRPTGPAGVTVELTIWFREKRPGHPAEFRLSPRPIPTVRGAVPDDFDETSLLVVEKDDSSFILRLITRQDDEYDAYEGLISVVKPAHRYGYGNRP